ncbi:MAG: polyprenol monophosphomannose synthase [Candidatus Omnitrophota bacterium]
MKTSVIIPTYNERENITPLVEEVLRNCPESEIIVVDDDSPDKTWQAVEEISKKDNRVVLVRRIGERGLTSAIQEGIKRSSKDTVVWMDSDFSMPPSAIPSMIGQLENSDIVVGSRYVKGGKDARGSFIRVLFSRALNVFGKLLLGTKVKDLTSGFVAAKRSVFDTISLSGNYGEYFIKFIYEAEKKGYSTKEVPYANVPRFKGETKTDPDIFRFFSLGWGYLAMILKLRFSKVKDS